MIYFQQIQVILEKTPLLEVEIDTGDSLPITQKTLHSSFETY